MTAALLLERTASYSSLESLINVVYLTCALVFVKEQLGWSKTFARVSRLERVRSISL